MKYLDDIFAYGAKVKTDTEPEAKETPTQPASETEPEGVVAEERDEDTSDKSHCGSEEGC